MTNSNEAPGWDVRYEWRAVTILAVGFSLVGLDRFMIAPLFPTMRASLGLSYSDIGLVTAALSLGYGIAAIWTGRLSDRWGRRNVAIPALIIFSLMAGTTGLASGLVSLLIIRAALGAAEGAYVPASLIAVVEASKPSRRGLASGIYQIANTVLSKVLAPIAITQLILIIHWRWIFVLATVPGLVVAYLMYKILRAPGVPKQPEVATQTQWTQVLRYRNVPICVGTFLCWLSGPIVAYALLPNYMTDYLHLTIQQMGWVLSSTGVGSICGLLAMPFISDRVGRKPVMVVSSAATLGLFWWFIHTGPVPFMLAALLFGIFFFVYPMIIMTAGPIVAESVPPALKATAAGLVIGLGELVGGTMAPIISGQVAQHYGIQFMLYVPLATASVGLLLALMMKETLSGAPGWVKP